MYFALEESQPEWESGLEDIQHRAEARATMFDGVLQQVEQTPDSLGAIGMEAAYALVQRLRIVENTCPL